MIDSTDCPRASFTLSATHRKNKKKEEQKKEERRTEERRITKRLQETLSNKEVQQNSQSKPHKYMFTVIKKASPKSGNGEVNRVNSPIF